MDAYFEKRKTPVTIVLSLLVRDEEVVKRILLRGKTSGRSDDNDEAEAGTYVELIFKL